MFIDSRKEVTKLREDAKFDWDVAPFPRLAESAGAQHSEGYCVAKDANTQAAWNFIEFATGPEGQKLLAQNGRIMPSLKSVTNSEAFLSPSEDPKNSQVFVDAIPNMKQLPNSPGWGAVDEASHQPIEEAFFESARVADLREVAEEFARNLNQETAGDF
jgi:multiple sugar transport system substrate-binding protein